MGGSAGTLDVAFGLHRATSYALRGGEARLRRRAPTACASAPPRPRLEFYRLAHVAGRAATYSLIFPRRWPTAVVVLISIEPQMVAPAVTTRETEAVE